MIEPSQYLARAKRKDNDAWETGSLVVIRGETSEEQVFLADEMTGALIPVQAETVGRLTGLTDKNGKKVFEGDIVRFRTRVDYFSGPYYVKWYEEGLRFLATMRDGVRSYPMDRCWEYEVLGNVYDNPDLLGGVSDGN